MLDERDERPGVKFKDADLVGIPFRVNVGKKVTEGIVEVVRRSTLERKDVKISAITRVFPGLRCDGRALAGGKSLGARGKLGVERRNQRFSEGFLCRLRN